MTEPAAFSYAKGVAPMMWVFLALATIELLVVHLLLSFWSQTAALILSAISLASIIWMVLLLRSMRRLPVLLDQRRLVMRVGTLICLEVDIDQVAGLRESYDDAFLRQGGVANLALMAWPNVVVELSPPLKRGRRQLRAVAHKLDDPASFRTALQQLMKQPETVA